MPLSHRFRELTWPEVNEAARRGPCLLIPVGAIEQHGPHLPVDVDNAITEHLCEEAARRSGGDVLVLPAIHYGYNAHNMDFPGTVSIRMEHFIAYCVDVGASLASQGFRHMFFVNAHGSNAPLCDLVGRRLTVECDVLAGAINHWELGWDFIGPELEGGPFAADHACEWETSEYLAIRPDLVRMDLAVDEIPAHRGGARWLYPGLEGQKWVHFMNHWSRMNDSGVAGTPTLATAEKGQRMLEGTIDRLVTVAREFRQMPIAPRIDHRVKPVA